MPSRLMPSGHKAGACARALAIKAIAPKANARYFVRLPRMARFLERALDHAAVDAERGAGCCRGEGAGDVSDKTGDLLGRGEAFDERGRANLLEEFGLELLEAFVAALCERAHEIDDAARLGRAGQHA